MTSQHPPPRNKFVKKMRVQDGVTPKPPNAVKPPPPPSATTAEEIATMVNETKAPSIASTKIATHTWDGLCRTQPYSNQGDVVEYPCPISLRPLPPLSEALTRSHSPPCGENPGIAP